MLVTNVTNGVAPQGTITFLDGTTPLTGAITYTSRPGDPNSGLYASISGTATEIFSTSGSHSITAKYSGDANYSPSVSQAFDVSVLYPTTMKVAAAPSTSVNLGSSITLTATITSSFNTPAITGQVTFQINNTNMPPTSSSLGTDSVGNQVLTASITFTPQASGGVNVLFGPDSNFQSQGEDLGIAVNIPDFSFSSPPVSPVTAGQSQTIMFTVMPASNTPSMVTLAPAQIPSGMSISFNPSTVNLSGSPINVVATVTTTGPSGGAGGQAIFQRFGMGFQTFPTPDLRLPWHCFRLL